MTAIRYVNAPFTLKTIPGRLGSVVFDCRCLLRAREQKKSELTGFFIYPFFHHRNIEVQSKLELTVVWFSNSVYVEATIVCLWSSYCSIVGPPYGGMIGFCVTGAGGQSTCCDPLSTLVVDCYPLPHMAQLDVVLYHSTFRVHNYWSPPRSEWSWWMWSVYRLLQ